ncbi:Hypp3910 [Branchiostoma lanceolatum]|uniref:Hypp3910 protein n=1 Tax=Branchiostoma lanceolatum TaxID=7740 RepID=A0A8K0A3G3_BRALA|nr:Hypp3910 [Branchiostoma lanceolatum]
MAPPLEPAIVVENPEGVNPGEEDPEEIDNQNKKKDPPGASAQAPRSVPKLTCKFSGEGSVDWEEFEDQIENERTYGAWEDALTLADSISITCPAEGFTCVPVSCSGS